MLWRWHFHSIPYVGLKQVALSQQQLFVINLVRFPSLNLKNLARFRIFHPKWLITLKICLFYFGKCYQSKIKMKNLYSKSQVSFNLVKYLGPASSVILLSFIDIAIWVQYFLPERLSENNSVLFSQVHSLLCTKLSMKGLQVLLKKLPNFPLIWNISF